MAASQWNASLYDTKHAFVSEKAKGLVNLLAAHPGEHILDLGCGTGTLTAEIAARGATVVGIDRSPEMIEQARRKFTTIRFEVCDARELRFSQEFDAVFSNAALHWIPEAEPVVRGVAAALRPDGRFVAEFGGKGNVRHVVAALESALRSLGISSGGVAPWYYPGIAEYSAILERHGLEVVEAALFDRPTELEDGQQGLANWLSMFCESFLNQVPEVNQPDYIRRVEDLSRPLLWKSDHWELDYRRLRIQAVKRTL
jgi:trans-aconitate methyltransferase